MITWNELKKVIIKNAIFMNLYRTPSMQKKYDAFQKKVLRHYESMNDYIYCTVFRYKCEKEKTKFRAIAETKFASLPEIKNQYIITENPFPYDLEKNIAHFVLWHNSYLSTTKVNKILKEHFKSDKILWYRSYRESVPEINHIHVFVQNTNSSS